MIDLDNYPDGTDEILVVLLNVKENVSQNEDRTEWMKRGMLKVHTSLNKQQVRYRCDKLSEEEFIVENTYKEHNQRVKIYKLTDSGIAAAEAIRETKDVLGEVPEEVGSDEILKLAHEIAALRTGFEDGTEPNVNDFTESIIRLRDRVQFIEHELGIKVADDYKIPIDD